MKELLKTHGVRLKAFEKQNDKTEVKETKESFRTNTTFSSEKIKYEKLQREPDKYKIIIIQGVRETYEQWLFEIATFPDI